MSCQIEHIIISPNHNFVGHYGKEPGANPTVYRERVNLIAGRGIEGDRYSRKEYGHPKQITFFDMATIDILSNHFGYPVKAELVRRNVFVSGLNLPELVGKKFSIQDIEFRGVDTCPPCQWMDFSIKDGSKNLMEGKGGLRAEILTDGALSVGQTEFKIISGTKCV